MRQIIDTGTLDIEPGCYVDGHWGWRGVIHQVLQFEGVVFHLSEADWSVIDRYDSVCDMADAEAMIALADEAEEMLNNALRPGLIAHWHDGEFFVSPHCDDETTCTDETCAHWCWT